MTLSNYEDTKNIKAFLVENITETHYKYADENPHCHSDAGQNKYLQQTLNSIDAFILSLLISHVGSCFKLLSMSWYRSI